MGARSNSLAWQTHVGGQLRRHRLAARKTAQQAADHVGCGQPKISKVERGLLGIRSSELSALLRFYEVSSDVVDSLVALNDCRDERPWWEFYLDAIPHWFRRYISLEAVAVEIRAYQSECIPGLLQTERYARAILVSMEPDAGEHAFRQPTEVRLARQQRLTSVDPIRLVNVIGEGALRQIVRSPDVMREQLAHLLEVSALPNVELYVLPFSSANRPISCTPFSLLDCPGHDTSVVYLECVQTALYVDRPAAAVGRYQVWFNRLQQASLDRAKSRVLIAKIAAEYAS